MRRRRPRGRTGAGRTGAGAASPSAANVATVALVLAAAVAGQRRGLSTLFSVPASPALLASPTTLAAQPSNSSPPAASQLPAAARGVGRPSAGVAGALIMEVSLDGLPLAEAGKLAWARVQAWGRTHGEANLATLLARFAADRRGVLDPQLNRTRRGSGGGGGSGSGGSGGSGGSQRGRWQDQRWPRVSKGLSAARPPLRRPFRRAARRVASERQKKRPQTRETQKQKKQNKKNGGVKMNWVSRSTLFLSRGAKTNKKRLLMNTSLSPAMFWQH